MLVIKNALRGSLLVGLSEGVGEMRQKFVDFFPLLASKLAPSCNDECNQIRFIHSPYIHDGTMFVAEALERLVNEKANTTNSPREGVQVTKNDQDLLVRNLFETEIPAGVTGRISFKNNRERDVFTFVIKNYVPIDNANFSLATAINENPWVLETRAVIEKGGNYTKFIYYTSEGEESNKSTIIFADGTTSFPSDRAFHIFNRGWLFLHELNHVIILLQDLR